MIIGQNAKYLNSVQSSFKDKNDGREVTFYKVTLIPSSDNIPLTFTCSEEVYTYCQTLAAFTDVFFELEMSDNRGYIRTRCNYVGTPQGGDIEY